MGTYVFKWTKPASSVYVTGSFDNWKKTEQLTKQDGVFSKKVQFPSATEVVHFKFFVDDAWVLDDSLPSDKDEQGNTNNILRPSDITPLGKEDSDMPGAFPAETPQAGRSSPQIPIFYPGDIVPDYSTYFAATSPNSTAKSRSEPVAETAKDKEQTFGVSPLPPSNSFGNPAPGTVNTNTTTSHVKLDQASYERSDAYPSSANEGSAILAATSGAFGVPPVTNTLIPESSLPMGEGATTRDPGLPTIQSAGPGTTTAALAAQVPLEPRGVPGQVSESQEEYVASPEASADPEAVQHKEKMEQELQKKVPEQPATSEDNIATKLGAAAAGAGGIVAAGAAAIGLSGPSQSEETKKQIASQGTETSQGVPAVVSDSQHIAHAAPEASSQPSAVAEKEQVEQELKKKVPEEPATSEDTIGGKAVAGAAAAGAAIVGGAAAAGAYATSKLPTSVQDSINPNSEPTKSVPGAVADSQHQAHASPEASANAEAVSEKSAVEKELLGKVPQHNESGEPAPTASAVTSTTAPGTGTTAANPSSTAKTGATGEPVIADESTMAAIAVANRSADAPVSGDAAGTNPSSAAHTGQTAAVAGGAVAAGGAATAATAGQSSGSAFEGDPVRAEGALGKAAGAAHSTIKNVTQEAKQSTVKAFQGDPVGAGEPASGAAAGATMAPPPTKIRAESRDVSPMTRGTGAGAGAPDSSAAAHNTGTVKSGSPFGNSEQTAATGTPGSAADSPASKEDKKKNRRSFFGRIKDKLRDK